ncbi:hypothetical protein BDV18DRAFT_164479 [Aspergillus unguis]
MMDYGGHHYHQQHHQSQHQQSHQSQQNAHSQQHMQSPALGAGVGAAAAAHRQALNNNAFASNSSLFRAQPQADMTGLSPSLRNMTTTSSQSLLGVPAGASFGSLSEYQQPTSTSDSLARRVSEEYAPRGQLPACVVELDYFIASYTGSHFFSATVVRST